MTKKDTIPNKPPEPWQLEDARRLRAIWDEKQDVPKSGKGKKKAFTQASFAEAHGLASSNMVWQYLNGHRALNVLAAASFANGLGVKVEAFSPALAAQADRVVKSHDMTPRLVSMPQGRRLQWVTDSEAALLSQFRARSEADQETALSFIRGLPRLIAEDADADNR